MTTETQYLGRDAILGAVDLKREEVEVPEWGGKVLIQELTAGQAEGFGYDMLNADGEMDARKTRGQMFRAIRMGVIDAEGNPVFNRNDQKALEDKSMSACQLVANKILSLSGMATDTDRPWSIKCSHCDEEIEINLTDELKAYNKAKRAEKEAEGQVDTKA